MSEVGWITNGVTYGDFAMLCPGCGSANLHHEVVEVFNRSSEDSDTGLHIEIEGLTVFQNPQMQRNPSSRRTGLVIHFECEPCESPVWLRITQHKGATLLEAGKDDDLVGE